MLHDRGLRNSLCDVHFLSLLYKIQEEWTMNISGHEQVTICWPDEERMGPRKYLKSINFVGRVLSNVGIELVMFVPVSSHAIVESVWTQKETKVITIVM